MIIILHTEGHGGVLNHTTFTQTNFFFSNYSIAWLLEITAYCAVNCYAMTSGYLSWNSSTKYSKLLYLWLQIVFYSLGIALLFSFFIDISAQQWLDALFPITSRQYWYATAYFGVFLLMPVLNSYLQSTNQKMLKLHLLMMFIFLILLPLILRKDPYQLTSGYSLLWLALMSLLGGAIAKSNLKDGLSRGRCLQLFFLMIALTWGNKFIIEYVNRFMGINIPYYNLISYISPTIILSALFLFLFFTKLTLTFRYAKLITLLSSASFGVYLIHDNGLIRQHIIAGYASHFAQDNPFIMVLEIIGCAICIYLICFMVDFLRNALFNLLKLNNRVKIIDQYLSK